MKLYHSTIFDSDINIMNNEIQSTYIKNMLDLERTFCIAFNQNCTIQITEREVSIQEIEEQRSGKNKQTTINHTYINSGSYRRKFDKISKDKQLNRLIYQLSKQILNHRSGTLYEDMYWIDIDKTKVVASETDSIKEKEIVYSNATKDVVLNNHNLITVHSHPNSYPPSISDLNSNYINNYLLGIIVCHDGRIYLYQANEEVSDKYYHLAVAEYIKNGYNEDEAQICALNEIQNKFNIQFREVKDNDL